MEAPVSVVIDALNLKPANILGFDYDRLFCLFSARGVGMLNPFYSLVHYVNESSLCHSQRLVHSGRKVPIGDLDRETFDMLVSHQATACPNQPNCRQPHDVALLKALPDLDKFDHSCTRNIMILDRAI